MFPVIDSGKSAAAEGTLEMYVHAIVVVEVVMRSAATRADNVSRNVAFRFVTSIDSLTVLS